MIGRDTGFDAGAVELRPSVGDANGGLVRPLGAFERMFHLNELKSTKHFCLVAELADDLDPASLDAGLLAVQRRHPLLNVHVEDHPQMRLGFYRRASVPPIPVTVVDAETGKTWRDVVAEELTRPFERSCAPMTRVALLCSGPSTPAAIVLTADHAIVDGLSAAYLLRDLFSALNGHDLTSQPVHDCVVGGQHDRGRGARPGAQQRSPGHRRAGAVEGAGQLLGDQVTPSAAGLSVHDGDWDRRHDRRAVEP
ncbi:MAG: hypothetical protein QOF88_5645, partial [Mycobacterium sp.]|nr:hypothetical protein [Mycobacterium sp.]